MFLVMAWRLLTAVTVSRRVIPASLNSALISSARPPGSVTWSSWMSPGGMGGKASAPRVGGLPARNSTTLRALVPTSRPTASILGLSQRDMRSRIEDIDDSSSKSWRAYHGTLTIQREKYQPGGPDAGVGKYPNERQGAG